MSQARLNTGSLVRSSIPIEMMTGEPVYSPHLNMGPYFHLTYRSYEARHFDPYSHRQYHTRQRVPHKAQMWYTQTGSDHNLSTFRNRKFEYILIHHHIGQMVLLLIITYYE